MDVKAPGSTRGGRSILRDLRAAEGGGIPGVAVKCVEIGRNTSGEGGLLGCFLTLKAKARVANRIRDPGSPSRKRWMLGVGGIDSLRAEANALSIPPGEYGRKAKTQTN